MGMLAPAFTVLSHSQQAAGSSLPLEADYARLATLTESEGANHERDQDYLVCCACCVRRGDGGGHGGVRATAVRRSGGGPSPGRRWSACKLHRYIMGCKCGRPQTTGSNEIRRWRPI